MNIDNVLNFLDFVDDLDDVDHHNRRTRVIRRRPAIFEDFDDLDFFKRYRLCKETFLFVLDKIDESLEFDSDRNKSVAPVNQLLIALRFYATGNHLLSIADQHGVSVPTASRIIKRVSQVIISKLRQNFIKMPSTPQEIQNLQTGFYNIAHFPYIIGTIDCTHVKIQSPGGDDAELFRNRKGYFSVNVQTISDPQLRILNVVARWPGSTHDSAIFINSRVCHDFEIGRYGDACLLGDSGYPLKRYLLTPYLQPNNIAQEQYNSSHIKTRNTVERQYGVLKRRFPALALGLRIKLETAINVIIACSILHNICIECNENIPPTEFEEGFLNTQINIGQMDHNNQVQNAAVGDRRAIITHNFFTN